MCGIYGEFFPNGNLSKEKEFNSFNDLNFYRGPDMMGRWTDGKQVQLGFRRLSIMDVSENGNQPMISMNQKFSMVFNGEIYNFKELKKELLNHHYQFKSESDSEVLVNYFECFGIKKTLDIIDGMFAIALFSNDEQKLYLIRDFAGIKPLFYSNTNGDIVFGSRYDQVAKHKNSINNKIDLEVLKTYLKLHYIPAPFGILKDTYQVEPGQCISINLKGEISDYHYWKFPDLDKENLISDKKEALTFLEQELETTVKDQLEADVPLGAFLSGGIDSPLVTKIAKKNKKDLKAFTIGSDSKTHDESEDAKKYANLIDVDLFLKEMKAEDASKLLSSTMKHLQEPFADFSVIPTFELTKNASQQFKVMLSGDGGDELFYGYERFESVSKNLKYTWVPKSLRYLFYGLDKVITKNNFINDCFLNRSLSSAHMGLHSRTNDTYLDKVFPKLVDIPSKDISCYKYSENTDRLTFLHHMRKAEFYGMMQKTLTKVDRMSMANSLEVRVPFLQKKFIEAAVKIHPDLSLGKQKKKQILKDLLKSLIPKAPIDNRKRGFTVPLSKWLKEDLKEEIQNALFDQEFLKMFSVSEIELTKVWEEHQYGLKDHKWFIFTLYSLQQWHKNLKK